MYAGIVSEERNAIIDYNEKFFLWLNLVSDISLGHTNKNNNAELDEFEKHIHDVYYNVLNSETKFKLFVNNDDFINLWSERQFGDVASSDPFDPEKDKDSSTIASTNKYMALIQMMRIYINGVK